MKDKHQDNSFIVNQDKIADFQTYCQRCKYADRRKTHDYPCYCCMGVYGRGIGHQIPEYFVERGTGKKDKSSTDSTY